MRVTSAVRCATAFVVLFQLSASPVAAQTTQADPVLEGYMRAYAGDRDSAFRHFETLHARDPQNLTAWFGRLFAQARRIELDDSLGPAFERELAAFLQTAEQRYSRSRADSEALFYLAQGYLLRSTYRFDHDKGIWGAARDASKSKGYLEEYIKRHPEHGDAYLALGLYNYYVDIAPNFIKFIRILLFLPSGNRTEGLKQLERAARDGNLFAPLAESALSEIYGTLEGRVDDAIRIAERLVQRFPANTEMRRDLARLYAHPTVEAYDRASAQYTAVLDQATGSSAEQIHARSRATLGLSDLRRAEWRLDDAIGLLTPTIDQHVAEPAWVLPTFLLRRANYRALMNDAGASTDARRVLSDPKMSNWHKAAERQIAFIDERKRSSEAAVYAALIPGNRCVVQHRWDEAAAAYDRVSALNPGDLQVQYRRAMLEFARGRYDAAARALEPIVSTSAPRWLKAAALLNLAWTHDVAGRRADALKLYKRIVDDYEDQPAAGSARVGMITPYRGRFAKVTSYQLPVHS